MPDPLDGLSAAQRAAVTHPGGPLLVAGGPGSGKTRVVTRRIAWLVEHGVPATAILGLAFSSAAAERMRCQVEALVERPYDELWIVGFGDLCRRLLREEALEAGLDPFFVSVTRADRVALLLERIDDLRLSHHEIRGNPAPLVASLVARIDQLKESLVGPGDVRRRAEGLLGRAGDDPAARARAERELEVAAVYDRHDDLLAERGALDSGDLVLRTERLLRERTGVRQRVAHRFGHLLVDDLQDASRAQSAVLGHLRGHGDVTVTGDDVGALLAGGDDSKLLAFLEEHPHATRVDLGRSRRCGQRILEAAGAVAAAGGGPGGKPARGREGVAAGEVRFWRCASERAQAQMVAGEAERLIAVEGVPPEEIGVLVPSVRGEGGALASALEERAVPFRLEGRRRCSSAPRSATCWPGCACSPTPPTRARRYAR